MIHPEVFKMMSFVVNGGKEGEKGPKKGERNSRIAPNLSGGGEP